MGSESLARPGGRLAVAVLERIGRSLWGFPPNLMAPIVAQLGPLRSVCWFVANMPRYERTLGVLGGFRTHLLCVAISLVNGCAYCTYGHAYAMQLIYFRDRGELFPIDEYEIGALVGGRRPDIRDFLVAALERAGKHSEVLALDRTLTMLAGDEPPVDRTEERMAHLVRMFGTLNSVGIASRAPLDEAHDPLNKDVLLKRCYTILRAAPVA